jgi:hypothetical protein
LAFVGESGTFDFDVCADEASLIWSASYSCKFRQFLPYVHCPSSLCQYAPCCKVK